LAATLARRDVVAQHVNTAGNLVLLSKAKNSSASNGEFAEKKKRYLRDRVSDYPRSMQVLEVESWTQAEITRRTSEIRSLILKDPTRSES